jgi:hypothetical protein
MRVNPLIHMPLANLGSHIDDVSAAVIITLTFALLSLMASVVILLLT